MDESSGPDDYDYSEYLKKRSHQNRSMNECRFGSHKEEIRRSKDH